MADRGIRRREPSQLTCLGQRSHEATTTKQSGQTRVRGKTTARWSVSGEGGSRIHGQPRTVRGGMLLENTGVDDRDGISRTEELRRGWGDGG